MILFFSYEYFTSDRRIFGPIYPHSAYIMNLTPYAIPFHNTGCRIAAQHKDQLREVLIFLRTFFAVRSLNKKED